MRPSSCQTERQPLSFPVLLFVPRARFSASIPLTLCPHKLTCTKACKRAINLLYFLPCFSWFNTSTSSDWVASKLFFEVRKHTPAHNDDKCAFITLGVPAAGGPTKLADDASGDMQFALDVDEWQTEMKSVDVFSQCSTFTYVEEDKMRILQKALEGQRNAYIRPSWEVR